MNICGEQKERAELRIPTEPRVNKKKRKKIVVLPAKYSKIN